MNWHLRKEVSVGHIISTLLLAFLLIGAWVETQTRFERMEHHLVSPSHAATELRLDIVEQEMSRVTAVDMALQLRLKDLQDQIIRRLDRHDTKLDRIEDRLNQHDMGSDGGG